MQYDKSLAKKYPQIAEEWHPTRNGSLKPSDVAAHSKICVWWMLSYDDPKTGKHFEFEWQASIRDRTSGGIGCPYLTGKAVWPGYNDLETQYPEVAKEWHPTMNGALKPSDVTATSHKRVWWSLSYDDPESGKHFNFEWLAAVCSRTAGGNGCPYLTGKAVWTGFNDLETRYPEVAKEWHPTRNGRLKPSDVTVSSKKLVWWMLPYDDPESGRHFEFEWQACINNRTSGGTGCPYLTGKAVWPGFNDLETRCPEVAKEWHPTRNGALKPSDVTPASHKHVWWLLSYDDPKTGKHFAFEWQASVMARTSNGTSCPFLSGKAVWPGYNDLETRYPKIAKEWHPTRNGALKPSEVTAFSGKRVWWELRYDDPASGRQIIFEWEARIIDRTFGKTGCPYLSGQAVWEGYNDLETRYPGIAKEWHPTKNGDLKPSEVTAASKRLVWWMLPYIDPESGRYFEFEWQAGIDDRTSGGTGCPYLTGKAVWPGYNDLETQYPEVAKEWHHTMNGALKPSDVTPTSHKRVWWELHYDDPVSGRHIIFEWKASVCGRTTGGKGCPYLTGKAVWPGFNDLATRYPEIAKEWHPERNGSLKPSEVTVASNKIVWWLFPYDDPISGRHFEFEWQTSVYNRTSRGTSCPYLTGNAVWSGFNDLETRYPEVAKEWHPTRNGALKPSDVTLAACKHVWWLLSYDDPKTGKHFEFEWQTSVANRTKGGNGCPYLTGKAVWPGFNDLATRYPEVAKEWHPERNGSLKPSEVTAASNKIVWWCFPYDDPMSGRHFDFEWKASVANRTQGGMGCPYLSGEAVWPGYNDLATRYPEIAKEWHATRNGSLKPSDVTAYSKKRIWWRLSYDDLESGKHFDFEWRSSVVNRTKGGNGCPFLSGKAVWPGYNDLATRFPEIAEAWDTILNGSLKPSDVTPSSLRRIWLRCQSCGRPLRNRVINHVKNGPLCKKCKKKIQAEL